MPVIDSMPAGGIVFDSNTPGWPGPAVVNAFTTLAIPAYWRAMNYIASNLASFPRYVAKNGVQVNHRLNPLLNRRPNSFQSNTQLWRTLFFHRAHVGNAYAEIQRDKLNNPSALIPHLPELVLPFRFITDDGEILTFYHVASELGRPSKILAAADMIHLSSLSWDGLSGMNPITMLYEAFERTRHVGRYMTRFLVKGTVVKGAVEIPAGVSEDQQKTIVNTINTHFRGSSAERDVLVLSDGAKLNNATLTPQESQLIEQAQFSTKEIAQITGVPPAMLFELSEGKYNATAEQAGQQVVKDLFRPLLSQDTDELSLKLLTDQEAAAGYSITFDDTALLKGDTVTTSNTTIAQVNAGLITKNEGREALGYGQVTDPEADKLVTLGASTPAAKTEPTPEQK